MPLVSTIYQVLTAPTDELDQVTANDKKMLQRSYYLFICTIVSNDVLDVLKNQGKFLSSLVVPPQNGNTSIYVK